VLVQVLGSRITTTTTTTTTRMSVPKFAKNIVSTDLASWQKITITYKGVGNESENDLQSKGLTACK